MRLQFDTSRVGPGERAGFWREVVCSVYVPMDAEPLARRAFHARMDARAAHGRVLSEVDAGPQRVSRDARQIPRSDERDIFTFMVQRAGSCEVEQAGARALLLPGDMLVFHNSQPYRLLFAQPFRQTVIQAPRACLGSYAGGLERRLAQRIPPASGFGRLLDSFVHGLSEALPEVEDAEASVLVDELFHLLAAQGAAAQAHAKGDDRSLRALLWRTQRYAREVIADPDLGIDALARAQCVSPRTLQRAFASEGTGVMRWLREARLAHCATALADRGQQHRGIAEIAAATGFRDTAAFCRSFKARFGCTPGAWRNTRCRDI
jgi:AraC-like DNA-binding protein